jgi:predicted hydrocarbon binding protein
MVEKEVIKQGEFLLEKRKKGYVSEFFNHLITYGGFSFGEGVMSVWGDPSIFTPQNGLVTYYKELQDNIGKDVEDVFYWIGHLYGKNSSLMLIKKFGFDKRKLSDFINGATQDGFGFIEADEMKYSDNFFEGEADGIDSNLAIGLRDKYGKQKRPVDYYMCGILAGGSEPLFGFPVHVEETDCIIKGSQKCHYKFNNIKKCEQFTFVKKLKWNSEEVIKKTIINGQKRTIKFNFLGKKEVKFGDGSFSLRGYKGFNMASYEHVILDMIALSLVGKNKFEKIKDLVVEASIKDTLDKSIYSNVVSSKAITSFLNHIKLFGYGNLELYRVSGDNFIIKNSNNPYSYDEKNLFGKVTDMSLSTVIRLLKFGFREYFNKDIEFTIMKNELNESFIKIKCK